LLLSSRHVAVFGHFARRWWNEPVDYAAQVEYFSKRAMAGAVQVLIGLGTGMNGVLSLVILLPSAGTPLAKVVTLMFAALQIFWGWLWCRRPWPSRAMSLAFLVSADIGIAAMAVVDGSWLLGLFGFNAFSMLSVYLMFFDGPRVLAGHVVWILLSTTAFAVRVSAEANFDSIVFTASTLAAVTPVVATPLGIQLGIWAMRNDANESVTDPLTGLLNRRGLHLHIAELLRGATAPDSEVAVMVLDLDRFKHINDTFGHPVGDEVLTRSARRIKSAVRGSALVARIGGEEFVIVDLAEPSGHWPWEFDRARAAIAASADPAVTASAGVTCIPVAGFSAPGVDPVALLDIAIERADQAMFFAKRDGGNATVHLRG
jgi:diguanylate cyclase (GGDEF)-like protein